MNRLVLVLGLVAWVALTACAMAAPGAIARRRDTWSSAATVSPSPFLANAASLSTTLSIIGFLGTIIGGVGIVSSATWGSASLIAARAERVAHEAGFRSPEGARSLAATFTVQAICAVALGTALLYWLAWGLLGNVDPSTGGNGLYGALLAQYGLSLLLVAGCNLLAGSRLRRLVADAPNKGIEQNATR